MPGNRYLGPTCNGHRKKDGRPCGAPAMANGKCRVHGGASLGGIASPTFKTGKYSTVIPRRMREAYEAELTDPNLLELREKMAVIGARIKDLLGRVNQGESGTYVDQIAATVKAMVKASADGDRDGFQAGFRDLQRLTGAAQSDHASWEEVARLTELYRRLMESEVKRMVTARTMMRRDELETLAAQIINLVRENVTDRTALANLQRGLLRLVGEGDRAGSGAG